MVVKDLAKAMDLLARAETVIRQSTVSPAVHGVADRVRGVLNEVGDLRSDLAGERRG